MLYMYVHFNPGLEFLDLYKPGAEDRCQSKEAAIGHLWCASVTSIHHPI